MKKIVWPILGIIIMGLIIVGIKTLFTTDKAFLDGKTFHSTPDCPKCSIGTEMSKREAYNDFNLKMCDECYSKLDIRNRDEHIKSILGK